MQAISKSQRVSSIIVVLCISLVFGATIFARAETSKETVPINFEFLNPDPNCLDGPVLMVLDGYENIHTTLTTNSTHIHSVIDFEVKVLDPITMVLLSTDQVKRISNINLNKLNETEHIIHIYRGQFVDGSEWHGTLIEKYTLNANGDLVVDFDHSNIHCP